MAQTFHIPVPRKGQIQLSFPDRCACCGAAREAESRMAITRLVTRGQRQEPVSVTYQIPHCRRCARSTKAVFLAGCIPFVLGALLVGGATFAAVALGAAALGFDEVGRPANANSLLLGAAAGLAAGLAGGLVFELAARLVLLPFFGRALLQAPLLTAQLLSDSDYVAGVRGTLDAHATQLQITFASDDVAREFQAMNAAILGR